MILIKLIFIGYLFYYIIDKLFQLTKKDNHSYKILIHEIMYDNYYNRIKKISPSSNIFTCPIEDKKIFTVICIDNKGFEKTLTIKKPYTVYAYYKDNGFTGSKLQYWIRNDNNEFMHYAQNRFIKY